MWDFDHVLETFSLPHWGHVTGKRSGFSINMNSHVSHLKYTFVGS